MTRTYDSSVVDEKHHLTRVRRHISTYNDIGQAPRLEEYQFAEGQANNHFYLDHAASWSYDSRVSDVDSAEFHLPNLLPTTNEGVYWYSGADPQLEDPARPVSPYWNTQTTLTGSEDFARPSQGSQTPYGHIEYLNATNEQHYGTNGAAMDAFEQRLCFGMVSAEQ